jgi:hypothetical protein
MRLLFHSLTLILFASCVSHAKSIDLVCTDGTGNSVSYAIDTSQNSVLSLGKAARNVAIEAGSIRFVLDREDGEWVHSIDRTTGKLTVLNPKKEIIPHIKCDKVKQKF